MTNLTKQPHHKSEKRSFLRVKNNLNLSLNQ